jgi:hypothetical protein
MELSQCNMLCNYLIQTKLQTELSTFKNGEQEGKTGSVWGLAPVGGERI